MTEAEWLDCTDPHALLNHLSGQEAGWTARLLGWFRSRRRGGRSRKLQLFACACCRRVWQLLVDERSRQAVESSERFADGLASRKELRRAAAAAASAAAGAIGPGLAAGPWLGAGQARAADAVAASFDRHEGAHRAATWAREAARAWGKGATVDLTSRARPPLPLPFNVQAPWRRKKRKRRDKNKAAQVGLDFPTEDSQAGDLAWQTERKFQSDLIRDIFGNPYRPPTFNEEWLTPAVRALARAIYDERAFERMPQLGDALAEAGCTDQDILSHCRGPGPHARGCWLVDWLLKR